MERGRSKAAGKERCQQGTMTEVSGDGSAGRVNKAQNIQLLHAGSSGKIDMRVRPAMAFTLSSKQPHCLSWEISLMDRRHRRQKEFFELFACLDYHVMM